MFILDTDHNGILQRKRGLEYVRLQQKIESINETDIYVTIISFHEQVVGWTKHVKGSLEQSKIVFGYLRLESILLDFSESQVLPYSPAASEVFEISHQVSRGPEGLFDEIQQSVRHRVLHAGVRREDA